jgi:hypothetical protein
MATTYVRARIALNSRVAVVTTSTSGAYHEGQQWHDKASFATKVIDKNEWRWRLNTAKAVLQYGTDPYGTTYTGAIGTAWM